MIDIAAYCYRIGYQGEFAPNLATLRSLHLAHLSAVPFENLDIHLGRPIVLDEALLFDKIVRRRRGGFCYELNGLFASLPRELGFEVTMLAAQFPLDEDRIGTAFDHLVLLTRAADIAHPLLVDIATGRRSFALPLRADSSDAQMQPEAGASFRLLPEKDGCRLWRQEPGGEWKRNTMNEELLALVDRELLGWPGIRKEQGRFNSTAYMLGRREIGHIHRNGVADLPFPRAVYDELIAAGRAEPHQAGVRGVVSVWIDDPDDIDQAIALFRMNYDRATANGDDSGEETG